jgi:hypothetical protein
MLVAEAEIEAAAKAMWDSEPVIYAWGPQERRRISWEKAAELNLIGVMIFRAFARVGLEAAQAFRTEREEEERRQIDDATKVIEANFKAFMQRRAIENTVEADEESKNDGRDHAGKPGKY